MEQDGKRPKWGHGSWPTPGCCRDELLSIARIGVATKEILREGDFAIPIPYGRVLRNFFISAITCASFER